MFRIRIHEQHKVPFMGEAYASFGIEQCGEEVSAIVYLTGTFRLLSNMVLSPSSVSLKTGTGSSLFVIRWKRYENLGYLSICLYHHDR